MTLTIPHPENLHFLDLVLQLLKNTVHRTIDRPKTAQDIK